jgi:hypothetical protein
VLHDLRVPATDTLPPQPDRYRTLSGP